MTICEPAKKCHFLPKLTRPRIAGELAERSLPQLFSIANCVLFKVQTINTEGILASANCVTVANCLLLVSILQPTHTLLTLDVLIGLICM